MDEDSQAGSGNAIEGGRETVLLVEDEEEVQKLEQRFLQSYGYQVLEAESPAETIGLTKRHRWSICAAFRDRHRQRDEQGNAEPYF